MHVGHLHAPQSLGIVFILEFRITCLRLNHVGDCTQFGMLIAYLRKLYPEALTTATPLDLGRDLVTLYRKSKTVFDEDEAFQNSRTEVVQLLRG